MIPGPPALQYYALTTRLKKEVFQIYTTEEDINEVFLARYRVSRATLQEMASKLGIELNHICYLKQEFDAFDPEASGVIDARDKVIFTLSLPFH